MQRGGVTGPHLPALERGVRPHPRVEVVLGVRATETVAADCPGRKPPQRAVKRPAPPYKTAAQDRISKNNAEGT
jgi:hypothetical protein